MWHLAAGWSLGAGRGWVPGEEDVTCVGGGAIFVSVYPLACSSQKREGGHFSNLRFFLIQLVWPFSRVRMFLEGSHSLMMFHPFVSSLVTVAPTSAALLVSFLFPAPAISVLPSGARSTASLWV